MMLKEVATLKNKRYHEVCKTAFVSSKEQYEKLLNWISGEFELYLQEEDYGLKIYVPNGNFHITPPEVINTLFEINIVIESKIKNDIEKISQQLNSILDHIKK